MAVIDRVKWDAPAGTLVWKFPEEELSTWTQLIVNESQEAFLVRGGQYEGPFGAGRHVLKTENIPVLRAFYGIPFGGKSPFSAEVWYVSKLIDLSVKWGTSDPIQVQDPRFGIMVPLRSFGQYGIRVVDTKTFLSKLVGTLPVFTMETLSSYFRGAMLMQIKSELARTVGEFGVSILEIGAHLDRLSEKLQLKLSESFAKYGIELTQFNITSISVPHDDSAVVSLRGALARRAEMSILGFDYGQQRSFDVMEKAAGNEGGAGQVIGAGLGLGIGAGIGSAAGAAMTGIVGNLNPTPTVAVTSEPSQGTTHADRIKAIRDLAELRNQGILTDEEFAAEKARLLS